MNFRMLGHPSVVFRVVGVQVVATDVQILGRKLGHEFINEPPKLAPPPPLVTSGGHPSGDHIQGGKKRARAVPLVVVTVARESLPIGEPNPTLISLQSLDAGLLTTSSPLLNADQQFEIQSKPRGSWDNHPA